ncbi:hypothetical protein CSA_021751 [Cucumis sativus]|uniref:Uncharacterized protein n=1 Tax=Cucumis sativus TaxID=3659 RepID=A0ACB6HBL8_CUCSA|nr:hypothetical protein CSA_021751 [Cucumis sativus]
MWHHLMTSFPPSVQKPQIHNFVQPTHWQKPPPILNLSNDIRLVLRAMMKLLVTLKMPKRTWLGDFNGVNIVTSGAMTNIGDCQDKFAQPPKDTSLLLKNGKTLNDICSIILVISNLL